MPITPQPNRYWVITYMVRAPRWVASGGNLHYIGTGTPTKAGMKALAMQVDPSITADDELYFTPVEYSADDYYRITGIQKPKTP